MGQGVTSELACNTQVTYVLRKDGEVNLYKYLSGSIYRTLTSKTHSIDPGPSPVRRPGPRST